jgi:hypothetical protein
MLVCGVGVCLATLVAPSRGSAQIFNPEVYYQIRAGHTGKCLDVPFAGVGNLVGLQQYACNAVAQQNQLWTVVPTGAGTYRIVSANSAKCLDIAGASTANGARAQQYECNLAFNQTNQVFTISPSPSGLAGFYRLTAANTASTASPKCVDVDGPLDGAIVQQWDCGPYWATNQDWRFDAFVARTPITHLRHFGYYNGLLGAYMTAAKDHTNNTQFDTDNPALITAANALGVKTQLGVIQQMFTYANKNGTLDDMGHLHDCGPTIPKDIYARCAGVGGLRLGWDTYWTNYLLPFVIAHQSELSMLYLDEPYGAFGYWGFNPTEIKSMLTLVTTKMRADLALAGVTVPLAVVDATQNAGYDFPGFDWVGLDCYSTNAVCLSPTNSMLPYHTILAGLKTRLSPAQGIIVVGLASVDRPKDSSRSGGACSTMTTTTQGERDNLVALSEYYINVALQEPSAVALLLWQGKSSYDGVCTHAANIGALDLPDVKAKWRFLGRGLGFGQP